MDSQPSDMGARADQPDTASRRGSEQISAGVIAFTQHKREEAALPETRRRIEGILENIADAYITIDPEWRCVYLNRAAEQLLGIPRQAALGQDIRQVYAATDLAQYFDRCRKALDERVTVEFEAYYPALETCVEVRVFPSDMGGITIYQRDISERKRVEERLRTNEERLHLLNENVRDYAIVMLDPLGRVLDWNVGAERIFGYAAEEMLGQDITPIFTREDIARGVPEQEVLTAMTQGRAEDERWQVRKDGTRFWASGITTAIRDEAGSLRGFWKIARDMTERMQAEAALIESEERLRIALDAAQMGTWDWEIAADRVVWNKEHFLLLGLEPDDAPRNYAAFEERVYPDDRDFVRQELLRSIEEGKRYRAQFRVIWPDGSIHWLAGEGRISYDSAGKAVRMIGVITEITARREAEAALRRVRDELELRVQERTRALEQANEALQREIAQRARAEAGRTELLRQLVTAEEEERKRISHELHDQMGQQLAALLLGLQQLKDASHGREGSLQAVEQLQQIADEIGWEVHQLALQLRPTALDDLGLPATLANYAAEWAQRTGIVVDFHSSTLEGARLPPPVETTLYRVVLEALTNVLKHAQARRVSIILERRDDHAIVIVEDDGRGFDAEALMGAPDAQRLGLLGMQERVALVGGALTIESSPGSGTSVFVRVPTDEQTGRESHG